jgi:hypothetical protein
VLPTTRLTPPVKLDDEWNELLTATEQVYRAEFGLYAMSPIPTRGAGRVVRRRVGRVVAIR